MKATSPQLNKPRRTEAEARRDRDLKAAIEQVDRMQRWLDHCAALNHDNPLAEEAAKGDKLSDLAFALRWAMRTAAGEPSMITSYYRHRDLRLIRDHVGNLRVRAREALTNKWPDDAQRCHRDAAAIETVLLAVDPRVET